MKPILAILALSLAGCATTAPGPATGNRGALAVRVGTALSMTPTLRNNPRYVPAAKELAKVAEAAITGDLVITPESIAFAVSEVCKRTGVAPDDVPLFVVAAQSVYSAYIEEYGPTVITPKDPHVRAYITAFSTGLRDAVAALQAANPTQ